jgi:hypothetical protein
LESFRNGVHLDPDSPHRLLYVLSVLPVFVASAVVFLWMWPWRPAAGHLAVLGLLGAINSTVASAPVFVARGLKKLWRPGVFPKGQRGFEPESKRFSSFAEPRA